MSRSSNPPTAERRRADSAAYAAQRKLVASWEMPPCLMPRTAKQVTDQAARVRAVQAVVRNHAAACEAYRAAGEDRALALATAQLDGTAFENELTMQLAEEDSKRQVHDKYTASDVENWAKQQMIATFFL